MHRLAKATLLIGLHMLGGCAAMSRSAPAVGDPLATVIAKFGQPSARYPAPGGQVLEYASGPFGQTTWMARMGPDGRLAVFEQVLTGEKFATLKIGTATKDEVLRTLGRPAERSYLALPDLDVWSYRYKESGVWNSMMHAHFDRAGVLRMMQNGPDRLYEEKRFFRD
jgi:hypothetical protein